jgi:Tol biopolymer transport system component
MADTAPSVQSIRAGSRLETWKEIAAYLKRDVRTVQRWEKTEGLPVRRHLHAKSATVYAHRAELDLWWEQRRPRLEAPEAGEPRSRRMVIGVLAVAVLSLSAVGLLWWRLPQAKGQPESRRLWMGPDTDHFGGVSPDGRLFAYSDKETDDLAIVDLETGREQKLTKKPPKAQTGGARAAAFSPDGKTIAFVWDEGSHVSVRLIGVDGAAERTLIRDPTIRDAAVAWSPDGNRVTASIRRAGATARIVAIDPVSGVETPLVDTGGQDVWRVDHSPDGAFIAVDVDRATKAGRRRQVYVVPAAGGEATPLLNHQDNDYLLGWTRNGVLFGCERTGATDGWLVPVKDGKQSGEPGLAFRGMGDVTSAGVSRDGSLYFGRRTSVADVYTAAVDWEAGKLISEPERASIRFAGVNGSPDWSADGSKLAYVPQRRRPTTWPMAKLMIRGAGDGGEREVSLALETLEMARWCPDGKSLVGVAFDSSAAYRLVRIDAASGETTPLNEAQARFTFHDPVCTGSRVLFKRRVGFTEPGVLVSLNMADRRETELLPSVYRMALSADGKRLVYSTFDSEREYIRVAELDGTGKPLEVHNEPRAGRIVSVAWDPSGNHVLFAKRDKLWRVSLAGGAPRELPLTAEALRELRVHPDGRRIAFTAGTSSKGELWVLRNVAARP